MKNGFVKVAVATPKIRVADPSFNAKELARLTKEADAIGVRAVVFPELCLTGYTCGDLFFTDSLICGAEQALKQYLSDTKNCTTISIIGLPVVYSGRLYNSAAVCRGGELLGIVPKKNLPNYGEFDEGRHFAIPSDEIGTISIGDCEASFGTNLLFSCKELPAFKLAVEICEDLFSAFPPSSAHALAGATVICNPAASNETVGKAEFRRTAIKAQSARARAAYLFASSGEGESTTDLVFAAHSIICENGTILSEKQPFDFANEMTVTEIDVERLALEQRKINAKNTEFIGKYREISFSMPLCESALTRAISPFPFIPDSAEERRARCESILAIQTQGLCQRIERAFAKKLVIGISGGLDSTLALLVMVRAIDALKRPRTDIIAVTMPCFGTTQRTKNNATVLCEELGVSFRTVDIFDAVNVHFRDIGHDPSDRNVTYENSQARERTQILMDIANDCGGMVIGTGDLSELALGWATYNGDHMSMYAVNASLPKTLIRHVVAHCADLAEKPAIAASLRDILDTPVSPELLPADENGDIAQKTEDLVGPYELHDFYIYYFCRFGFAPEKLFRMAKHAFGGAYSDAVLIKWLETFTRRFFSQQFKRSCMPDGPKVGSVTLSPRGDWKMPSDASSAAWLAQIEVLKKTYLQ